VYIFVISFGFCFQCVVVCVYKSQNWNYN